MELMFAAQSAGPPAALPAGSASLYTAVSALIDEGQQAGRLPPGDREHLRLLFMAASLGLTALVTSGAVQAGQIDASVPRAALTSRRQAISADRSWADRCAGIIGSVARQRRPATRMYRPSPVYSVTLPSVRYLSAGVQ